MAIIVDRGDHAGMFVSDCAHSFENAGYFGLYACVSLLSLWLS